MSPELIAECAVESEYDERHDHYGENSVAQKDREIDRADNTCSLKTRSAVMIVIREIRSQKQE